MSSHEITCAINGRDVHDIVESRTLLSDYLRHERNLTGTHIGCEQGVCGACTVLINGEPARSCLTFAYQVDGHRVTTVEGLSEDGPNLVQRELVRCDAFQCGFCAPGFVVTATYLAGLNEPPTTDADVRAALSGNLCRCTGYAPIVAAVRAACTAATAPLASFGDS